MLLKQTMQVFTTITTIRRLNNMVDVMVFTNGREVSFYEDEFNELIDHIEGLVDLAMLQYKLDNTGDALKNLQLIKEQLTDIKEQL